MNPARNKDKNVSVVNSSLPTTVSSTVVNSSSVIVAMDKTKTIIAKPVLE